MTKRSAMRAALFVQMGKAGILELKDVAAKSGVSKYTISTLGTGVKVSTLMKIAGGLGCTPADLLQGLRATDTKEKP